MKLNTAKLKRYVRKISNNNLPLNIISKYRIYTKKAETFFPEIVKSIKERNDRKNDQ